MLDTGINAGLTGLDRPKSQGMNKISNAESTVAWKALHQNGKGPKFDIRMKRVLERHHYSESSLS